MHLQVQKFNTETSIEYLYDQVAVYRQQMSAILLCIASVFVLVATDSRHFSYHLVCGLCEAQRRRPVLCCFLLLQRFVGLLSKHHR